MNAHAMTAYGLPVHFLSGGLIFAGFALLASAWRALQFARQRDVLAVRGPYSFVRHPQYVALLLIVLGVLLQWPSLPMLLMFPVLTWSYVRLAGREDRRMAKEFGWCWRAYAYGRPAFVPRLSRIHLALADLGRFARGRVDPKALTAGAGAPLTHGRTRS